MLSRNTIGSNKGSLLGNGDGLGQVYVIRNCHRTCRQGVVGITSTICNQIMELSGRHGNRCDFVVTHFTNISQHIGNIRADITEGYRFRLKRRSGVSINKGVKFSSRNGDCCYAVVSNFTAVRQDNCLTGINRPNSNRVCVECVISQTTPCSSLRVTQRHGINLISLKLSKVSQDCSFSIRESYSPIS